MGLSNNNNITNNKYHKNYNNNYKLNNNILNNNDYPSSLKYKSQRINPHYNNINGIGLDKPYEKNNLKPIINGGRRGGGGNLIAIGYEAKKKSIFDNDNYISKSILSGAYDILYSSAANTPTRLSANITTTKKILTMAGTGTTGSAPAWDVLTASDIGLGNV